MAEFCICWMGINPCVISLEMWLSWHLWNSLPPLCPALLTGDGMVEGEFKFSPLWEGNSPGKALFCRQHMILIFLNFVFIFLFLFIFFAIYTVFGRCFHNLAALRVKLETLSHFQIIFDFNLTVRNVYF